MTDKEQRIVDGVDVSSCPACNLNCGIPQCSEFFKHFSSNIYCRDNANCLFKQLARKTQECEQKQKIIEELKKEAKRISANYIKDEARYRKALEEIEEMAKKGLNPICYKSNCSRCQCYDGDDCKSGMTALINSYFTENGEFADGNGDFIEALESLLDKERSRCNRAKPISQQILDIINKVKGEE